jgi:hypothetical protein
VAASFLCDNDHSYSVKGGGGGYLDQLSDYYLLRKNFASWG